MLNMVIKAYVVTFLKHDLPFFCIEGCAGVLLIKERPSLFKEFSRQIAFS